MAGDFKRKRSRILRATLTGATKVPSVSHAARVLLASFTGVHSRVTKQSEWEDEEQGNGPSFSRPDIPLSGNAFYER